MICLSCKDNSLFCDCNLGHPKELLDSVAKSSGINLTKILKIKNLDKLTCYQDAKLVKGRVVYRGTGISAEFNGVSYPVSFVDFDLLLNHGVSYYVNNELFTAVEEVKEVEQKEIESKPLIDEFGDWEEFSVQKKILGKIVTQDDLISFVLSLRKYGKYNKIQLISDLHAYVKEIQHNQFNYQTELDIIKRFYLKHHLHFITALTLLLSYLPEAKSKGSRYALPIVSSDFAQVGFYDKTLNELLGVIILADNNVYPNSELEEFYADLKVVIGSRSVIEILLLNVCNGAKTDLLYKKILNF